MKNPFVSVIMAVKNGERFLNEAIESVLAQDYQPFEIIVIDGQSTDSSATIAKSYPSIRYILQSGKGIADAYNIGVEAAKGEMISFLSHDDIWSPNKLSVQLNYFLEHPEIQYVVAKIKYFLHEGHSVPPNFMVEFFDGTHTGIIMETLVVRRRLFNVIGNFDVGYENAEDTDWFARAIDFGIPMAVVPEVLLLKRVHDQNLSLNFGGNNRLILKAMRQSINRKRGL